MTQAQINYIAYFVEKIEEATGSEKKALELRLKLYCKEKGFDYPFAETVNSHKQGRAGPKVARGSRHEIKAMGDLVEGKKSEVKMVSSTDAKCENCGKSFERKRKDAKFCSSACRLQNHRKNNQ